MWLLLATPALAWTVRTTEAGHPVQWQGFPVAWSAAPGTAPLPPGGDAALGAGFDRWQGPDREVAFVLGVPPDVVPEATPDDPNHVWVLAEWPFPDDDTLAMSSVWSDAGGNIVGFDVRVNGESPWSTDGSPDAWDLQAAITHEVGHVLGLEHSDVEEAVMWHSASAGDTSRRDLSEDDEDAVRALYPLVDEPAGCSCAGPAGSWCALLGALLLVRRPAPMQKEDRCSRRC